MIFQPLLGDSLHSCFMQAPSGSTWARSGHTCVPTWRARGRQRDRVLFLFPRPSCERTSGPPCLTLPES
ncbi:hypothetical protein V5799_029794 [Amblyomma americanum]|uniref:Uncharacterized protein n=1 Tax=Amblyomma americanum TaxID=6943 RepID=A0AAQ4EQ72_AMBAM